MTTAALLAALLVSAGSNGQQSMTERIRQVEDAKQLTQALPLGASVEEIGKLTARLGLPEVTLARCNAEGCNKAFDELGASVRVHSWEVADQHLYLVFCGRRNDWHLAAADLTPARLRTYFAEDKKATLARKDDEQAKACVVE